MVLFIQEKLLHIAIFTLIIILSPIMKNRQICRYYLQGSCRFGNKCFNSHDHIGEGLVEGLMIRHAESQFNRLAEYFPGGNFNGEQCKKQMQLNLKLIDCPLSQKGGKQASKTKLPFKQIDIIFISPLTRALETAQIIIKANRLKVKYYIVLPQLTEVLSKVCDFGSSIQQKRKKFPKFDFGEMSRLLKENEHINGEQEWQDTLVDMDYYQHIQRQLPFGERYMYILENIFPTPLESSERCFNRSLRALQIIKSISSNLKATRVMLVSHNRILKYIDGRFSQGRAASFENCEIRPIMF